MSWRTGWPPSSTSSHCTGMSGEQRREAPLLLTLSSSIDAVLSQMHSDDHGTKLSWWYLCDLLTGTVPHTQTNGHVATASGSRQAGPAAVPHRAVRHRPGAHFTDLFAKSCEISTPTMNVRYAHSRKKYVCLKPHDHCSSFSISRRGTLAQPSARAGKQQKPSSSG